MKNIIKKIIMILLVLIIVLIGVILIYEKISKEIKQKIELGNSIYEKIHNLYYYGGNIEYQLDKNKNRKYIEIADSKYYEIKNPDEITNLITNEMLPKTSLFLNIKIVGNKYYMKDIGRGLSGYVGTTLKIKRISKNKIEYEAISKFCKVDSIVSYGDGCRNRDYYEMKKSFTLIKEDNLWKVLEYTSIFEF